MRRTLSQSAAMSATAWTLSRALMRASFSAFRYAQYGCQYLDISHTVHFILPLSPIHVPAQLLRHEAQLCIGCCLWQASWSHRERRSCLLDEEAEGGIC